LRPGFDLYVSSTIVFQSAKDRPERSNIKIEQSAALVVISDVHTEGARETAGTTENQTQGLSCFDDVDGILAACTWYLRDQYVSRKHHLQ